MQLSVVLVCFAVTMVGVFVLLFGAMDALSASDVLMAVMREDAVSCHVRRIVIH